MSELTPEPDSTGDKKQNKKQKQKQKFVKKK
jgi:hypothetical protein